MFKDIKIIEMIELNNAGNKKAKTANNKLGEMIEKVRNIELKKLRRKTKNVEFKRGSDRTNVEKVYLEKKMRMALSNGKLNDLKDLAKYLKVENESLSPSMPSNPQTIKNKLIKNIINKKLQK